MTEKIITGADFQERNRHIVEKKKKATFEELKSTIISIVNSVWENTAGSVVEVINLQKRLTPFEIDFIGANEEEVTNWAKETLQLILFEDEDYGYELEVPKKQ